MLATRLLIMSIAAGVPLLAPLAHTLLYTLIPSFAPVDFSLDVLAPSAALWGIGGAALLVAGPSFCFGTGPALLLLGLVSLGFLAAPAPGPSLLPYILGASCFLAANRLGMDRRQVLKYMRLTSLVAVLVALYALVQALWNLVFSGVTIFLPFGNRVVSTMGNPTFLADYLAMHAPITAGLCLAAPRRMEHILWAAGSALLLTAILLTGSKGGQLAAALSVAAYLGYSAWHLSFPRSRFYLPAALGAIALTGMTLYSSSLSSALLRWISPAERFSFSQRAQIALGGARLLTRAPVLGNGAGSFPAMFPLFQSEALDRDLGVALYVNHAHNDYLEVACDLGIAGLGILILIGISAFACLRPRREPLKFSLMAAGVSMATNFLVSLPSSSFFIWIHAGFLAPRGPAPPSPKLAQRSFRVLLALMLALISVRYLLGSGFFSVGAAALEGQHPDQAVIVLQRASLLLPGNRHVFQQLGRALELEGQIGPAIASFERAQTIGPHYPITSLNLGRVYRERFRLSGDPMDRERALKALAHTIEANGFQIDAREWGAEMALAAGRLDFAAVFLGRLPAGLPATPGFFWLRAKWLNRRGMQEAALAAMERGDMLAARLEIRRADAALAGGNPAQAERLLRALSERSPEYPAAWEALGYVLSATGRQREARECFVRMAGLAPDSVVAHLNVAITSLNLLELDRAEEAITQALAISPDNPDVRLALARLRARQGRYARAREEYERLLSRDPGHAHARDELGKLPP